MANRLPWFPFYVDDYLHDTYDLSPCEHGVYLLLLSRFWVSGPLRDDLDALCRVAAGAQPQMVREILERFWTLTGHGWINARMRSEMQKSEATRARAVEANRVRWGKNAIKTTKAPVQMDVQMESYPHPHPHPQSQTEEIPPNPPKTKARNDATPEGVDPQAWADFTAHRREIRKPLTALSATKSANILRAMPRNQQREAVNATISNCWTGLFPPKSGREAVKIPAESEWGKFLPEDRGRGAIDADYEVTK